MIENQTVLFSKPHRIFKYLFYFYQEIYVNEKKRIESRANF